MTRSKPVKTLNAVINAVPNTGGFHNDQFWTPIHAIRNAVIEAGYEAACVQSEYQHDPKTGLAMSKVWLYEVPYTSDAGKQSPVYIRIVAAGAGSVQEPLNTYDVVAYAS